MAFCIITWRFAKFSKDTTKYEKRYLTKVCKKTIAKPLKGVYYVDGDIFPVQIIIIHELPPGEALYLCCLTNRLKKLLSMQG